MLARSDVSDSERTSVVDIFWGGMLCKYAKAHRLRHTFAAPHVYREHHQWEGERVVRIESRVRPNDA